MGVLFKNTDITIYNHYIDGLTKVDKYQRTIIKEVNWQSKRIVTVTDKGINVAYITMIFIDKFDNYVSPRQFKLLADIDKVDYFTFSDLDKIVKGAITFEVTKIADLDKNYDDVITIVGTRKLSNHVEVEGK